jgi:hypothetical protein
VVVGAPFRKNVLFSLSTFNVALGANWEKYVQVIGVKQKVQ